MYQDWKCAQCTEVSKYHSRDGLLGRAVSSLAWVDTERPLGELKQLDLGSLLTLSQAEEAGRIISCWVRYYTFPSQSCWEGSLSTKSHPGRHVSLPLFRMTQESASFLPFSLCSKDASPPTSCFLPFPKAPPCGCLPSPTWLNSRQFNSNTMTYSPSLLYSPPPRSHRDLQHTYPAFLSYRF